MTDIKIITLNDLVDSIVKANGIIEETEAEVKMLKDEVRDRLVQMKIQGTKAGNYLVSLVKRLSTSNVEIGQARELGCIKESIDSEKIRQLVLKGIKIRGIKWTEFINIREAK